MTSHDRVVAFRSEFQELAKEAENQIFICRASQLQRDCVDRINRALVEVLAIKSACILECVEDLANEMLAYQFMLQALRSEISMYLALKADQAGEAWNYLVDAQMAAADAVRSHEHAARLQEVYIKRLYALEKTLFPRQIFFSTGTVVSESRCTICNSIYGDCDHIEGRPYMGSLCACRIEKFELREVSLVLDPADKRCRVLSWTDEAGIARDNLSMSPIP